MATPRRRPFVLAEDRAHIDAFNLGAQPEHRVDLDALPEPFIGSWDARFVLLSLNPGSDPDDRELHSRPHVDALLRRNLRGEATSFYYFDETLRDSPGGRWWRKRLAPVVKAIGERATGGLLVVEYFPYHSARFHRSTPHVPSQAFSVALVRAAMARNAWIVCMRARKAWSAAIPELETYARCGSLRNPQNVTISPRNFDRFALATSALVHDASSTKRNTLGIAHIEPVRPELSGGSLFDPVDDYDGG